jgi:N-sulfoglucosamine sulfohydrolase
MNTSFRFRSLVLAALFPLLFGNARGADAQKNVVVIVADDLGRQLGCYGDKAARTPHLDALAAEGTRFDLAFCTTASCSPSRSVILTGLHNHSNGQYGLQHATHNFGARTFVRSLPVLLRKAGYRTCSIGKMHVQPEELFRFERYANEGIAGGRNPVRMAENAEAFLREEDSRPFFLYFCPTDPHRAQTGFANETRYAGVEPQTFDPAKVPVPAYLPDLPEVRQELAEFYQSVNRVDQGVGRLLRALRETGHDKHTLILFLSDNGIPFPGAKTTVYDAGTRLPLLVRDPAQVDPGLVSQALVSWVDLAPTILDFAGIAGPDYPLHGKSLLPLLRGEADNSAPLLERDAVFASHSFHEVTMYYPMRSIRTRKFRYIFNLAHQLPFPAAQDLWSSPTWQTILARNDERYGRRNVRDYIHRPRHELYDLEADPDEVVNLADRPEQAKILAELQQRVHEFQKQTNDPWLIKYEHE